MPEYTSSIGNPSPGLGLPMDQVYAGMVIGSAYLAFVAMRRIALHFGWHEPPPSSLEIG